METRALEVALVRRIVPHLGAGLKAATLRPRIPLETDDGIPGVLVLDDRGRVTHHTSSAERLLKDLGDLGPGWREDGSLPTTVWMVVGALRRSLKPERERDRSAVPRLCVRARSGRWLTLQAARSEPASDGEVGTMVLIEPAGPVEMARLNIAAYGLSAREREVSEYTVQDHLSNVFDKVGVRSRRALLKRIFFDNIYPTLFD